ncbi:MAG TPA: DUF4388 domain-containing protein [Thermoanaerobaculia bacterium]
MLEGEIRDIDLVARLVELWREQFTGAIRFENDGIIKIIYFKGGDVLSASTNDRADSVDEILMRAEKVSREHVKQALAKRKENETLGDTLLNLGFITRKELTWARRVQVVGVIRSIGEWSAGSYTIVNDYLPKRDEGTIFPLPQIIVEMVVTDQDRQKFEKLLESGSAVFSKAPEFDETFKRLGFNEEAEAVVAQVDGARSASEIAAASGQETFNAYKLLHALSLLGLLTRAKAAASAPSSTGTFEKIGVADAADAWSAPMPKFDLADEQPGQETTPLRTPAPPPLPPLEPQFGFDEAQIDIAQQASVPVAASLPTPLPTPIPTPIPTPVPTPAPRTRGFSSMSTSTRRPLPPKTIKKKRLSFGGLVTIMALFIIAGIGWYGFTWWSARNAPQATPVKRAVHRPSEAPPPPPATTSVAPATSTATAPPPPPPPPTTTTQAPAPRPSPTSDRERYEAMAREFAAAPSGKFTVQFEIVCEPSNITKALRAGGTNVWFVPITLKGRSCYRVFWGHYPTREAGERGMSDIPATLREAKPSVIPVPQP